MIKMSKKNRITATLSVDGKEVKAITKLDKEGNQAWIKFSPTGKNGLEYGAHVFPKEKIEKNHIDVYLNGKKLKEETIYSKNVGLAGIAIVRNSTGEKKFVNLPPRIVPEEKLKRPMTDREKLEEFIKRVKVINPDK